MNVGEGRQCVLFLTDSVEPRIMGHFDRLSEESPFQTFLCYSDRIQFDRHGVRLNYESAATRFRYRRPTGPLNMPRPFIPGSVDLLWLEAVAAISRQQAFDFYWVVEYDVDFSGNWSRLFNAFAENRADLIGIHSDYRRNTEPWMWWPTFDPPSEIPIEHHVKAYLPLSRISARLTDKTCEIYDRSPCGGHFEALLPTLCSYFGMVMEDIGLDSPFGRGETWIAANETFQAGCDGLPNNYFHEDPAAFDRPNLLWHPVKVEASPDYDWNVLGKAPSLPASDE